jgi:hypothetical protein
MPYDFVMAFRTLAQQGAQMVLVLSSVYFNRDRPHIAGLVMQHGLPTTTMFTSKLYVETGGLVFLRAEPRRDVRPRGRLRLLLTCLAIRELRLIARCHC